MGSVNVNNGLVQTWTTISTGLLICMKPGLPGSRTAEMTHILDCNKKYKNNASFLSFYNRKWTNLQ